MRIRPSDKSRKEAELDITPTIDVVFLLLIFFIATIRMPKPEANIQAYLPKTVAGQGAGKTEEKEKEEINVINIALRSVGGNDVQVILNGAVLAGGFGRLNAALASLRYIVKQTPDAKSEVVLDADKRVQYRYVVKALDLCGMHGFENVSFAMPPAEKGGT